MGMGSTTTVPDQEEITTMFPGQEIVHDNRTEGDRVTMDHLGEEGTKTATIDTKSEAIGNRIGTTTTVRRNVRIATASHLDMGITIPGRPGVNRRIVMPTPLGGSLRNIGTLTKIGLEVIME